MSWSLALPFLLGSGIGGALVGGWTMWLREKALRQLDAANVKMATLQNVIGEAQTEAQRLKQVNDETKRELADADANTREVLAAAHAAGVDLSRVQWDGLRATAGSPVRAGGDAVPGAAPADVPAKPQPKPVP